MKASRARTFRTPVVTVLLAFAGGCQPDEPAEAAPLSACAADEPEVGAACEGVLSCEYRPSSCGYTRRYRCEDGGIRRYVSTCNPPALGEAGVDPSRPGASTSDAAAGDAGPACPTQLPAEGAACSGDFSCVYERGTCGEAPLVAARCRDGAISIARTACIPRSWLDAGGTDGARTDPASGS